jgi:hypothetical protein
MLGRGMARFNRQVLNRLTRPLARHLPGFGVIIHRGRRTDRLYKTPVNVFRRDGDYAVALTYGPESDWVKAAGTARAGMTNAAHHLCGKRRRRRCDLIQVNMARLVFRCRQPPASITPCLR